MGRLVGKAGGAGRAELVVPAHDRGAPCGLRGRAHPGRASVAFGSSADSGGSPVALRPALTSGLPFRGACAVSELRNRTGCARLEATETRRSASGPTGLTHAARAPRRGARRGPGRRSRRRGSPPAPGCGSRRAPSRRRAPARAAPQTASARRRTGAPARCPTGRRASRRRRTRCCNARTRLPALALLVGMAGEDEHRPPVDLAHLRHLDLPEARGLGHGRAELPVRRSALRACARTPSLNRGASLSRAVTSMCQPSPPGSRNTNGSRQVSLAPCRRRASGTSAGRPGRWVPCRPAARCEVVRLRHAEALVEDATPGGGQPV